MYELNILEHADIIICRCFKFRYNGLRIVISVKQTETSKNCHTIVEFHFIFIES